MIEDKRAKLTIFLVLCSLLVGLQNIATVRAAEDSWTTLAPLPESSHTIGATVVDGKIYVIGWST